MTPTPPSTTSSSAGHSPDTQYRVVRKRNRVPLSCGPCRHRKLKCNRAHPCDNCTKRGDVDNCTYATPGARKKNQTSANGSNASPDDMQNRIDRLEGLVLSLMTNGPQAAGPAAAAAAIAGQNVPASVSGSSQDARLDVDNPEMIQEEDEMNGEDSEVDRVTKSMGVMKVDGQGKAFFASEAHWYAILGEIAEVKNFFAEHKKQYEEHFRRVKAQSQDDENPGTAFLFRSYNRLSRNEIMQQFPPKHVADLLITRYFNSYYPALHIIHGPTFQRQYDAHWNSPSESTTMWFGLAFAMMALALQSYQSAGDEPPEFRGRTWEMSKDYRRLTAQTLIEGDLLGLSKHTIETIILHVQAEYQRSRDAEFGIQIAVSVLVRLAMKMGYHRDSRPYPNITPFHGEMRRRIWANVRQFDLLFSFQNGLPPMIRPCDTNVEVPRNLYDDELYEEMPALPPSRPDSEITPCSFMIAKTRALLAFSDILDTVQTFKCCPYEDIMKLDQRLRELHGSFPPHLQMRSLDESSRDTSSLIIQRYHLDLLVLRSQVVLHRKFLVHARLNSRFAYSRRTCIDASMTMLSHQATLQSESRPGGRLRQVKWFTSSLTTNEFLLAGMIICLDLYHTAEAERSGRRAATELYDTWSQERRASMLAAIEGSLNIWKELKDQSMEAYKAQGTLGVMISKLKEHQVIRQAQQAYPATANMGAPPFNGTDDANVAPEHSAAMTLGMLSTGGLTPGSTNLFSGGTFGGFDTGQSPPQPMTATTASGSTGSGLTPNWSSNGGDPGKDGPMNAPSPFSQMFGASSVGGNFQSMDLPTDWDTWDSYVGGASLDPTNQMWGLNMDLGAPLNGIDNLAQQGTEQQQPQQDGQTNGVYAGVGGPFMGVSTPPKNTMM
ncbi:hypothetical protein NA57DRAFT_65585 [Rhizodiscina lignyota]|uniref:Zn(2)-C6 fungal-type domain-containing protein n=1 Tax=Rhizodiscina lignyota TaxID=1504668 RepID=A0A9P4IH61_9PEZI|nr:hypothetical protein NA57DRAFT_65585 [Rhizodiscina lignyota]